MNAQPERLGPHTLSLITDERNQLLLSAMSSLEIAMKYRQGRIHLPKPPDQYVPDRMLASVVEGIPLEHSHALRVSRLDDHHTDPFDRVLVGQAMLEDIPIISADRSLTDYEIECIDATK
jgi:PIN domain nuclease of toxin-antitoxin system